LATPVLTSASSNSSPQTARAASIAVAAAVVAVVGFLLWSGLVAPFEDRRPVPSPDGNHFAYFTRRAEPQNGRTHDLVIATPEGRSVARIASTPGTLEWSNAGHLALMDFGRTRVTLIAAIPRGFLVVTDLALAPGTEPQWSRDGNKFAYRREMPQGEGFAVYDLPQTLAQAVPVDGNFPFEDPQLLFWSPDGNYLYFLNGVGERTVLARLEVASGQAQVIVKGEAGWRGARRNAPEMAPDGAKILLKGETRAVVDAETGERIWELPEDAQSLWWPWSEDGRSFYFWRRGDPSSIYARNFETVTDEAVVRGVTPAGFFGREGKRYFYQRTEENSEEGLAEDRARVFGAGGEWAVVETESGARRSLDEFDLWPWQQTVEGNILARRAGRWRAELGFLQPEQMEFLPFEFPGAREEIRQNLDRYGTRLFLVVFYVLLALAALLTRPLSASARAFAALNFLAAIWLAAWTSGESARALEPPNPYRLLPGEEGAALRASFPGLGAAWFETAQALLAALAPPLWLRFFVAFPDGNRAWSGRRAVLVMLGAATLVPLGWLLLPSLAPGLWSDLPAWTILLAAFAAVGGGFVALLTNSRRPGDRRSREQVRWVSAVLVVLAVGCPVGWLLGRSGAGNEGSAIAYLLGTLASATLGVVALGAPAAVLYALVTARPRDLRSFARRGFRGLIVIGPALVLFFLSVVVIDVLLPGVSRNASSSVWFLSAVLATALYVPLVRRLRRAADRLAGQGADEFRGEIESIAQELPHLLDYAALLGGIRHALRRTLRVQRCFLFVLDREARRYRLKGEERELEPVLGRMEFHPAEPLCRFLAQEASFLEVEISPYDPRLIPVLQGAADRFAALRAEVVFGLRRRNELLGMLAVGPKDSGEFYETVELGLLERVASQAAVALENIEVFEELARDRELRRELEDASEMQAQLLPSLVPRLRSAQLAGRCVPARMVSGDYYDFLKLPGGRIGLALGDVAGRGMAASLQMATLQSLVRAQAPTTEDLGEYFRQVNTQLFATSEGRRPCAVFYGVYDDSNRRFEYVNAGHPPPLLVQGSVVRTLEPTGLVLGLFSDVRHVSRFERLEPGTLLVLYSDGIPNATNVRGETFGLVRFVESVIRARDQEIQRMIDRVFGDVREFMGGIPTEDDQTLVILKLHPA
jgi:serine phosphatase RsbU (regulator of sigma subunit)